MSDDDDGIDAQREWAEEYWTRLIDLTASRVSTIEFYSRVKVDDNATVTLGEWNGYYIQILPQGCTNRLVMARIAVAGVYDYGWCFESGPDAALAAVVWNPRRDPEPYGFTMRIGAKRLAGERASRDKPNG